MLTDEDIKEAQALWFELVPNSDLTLIISNDLADHDREITDFIFDSGTPTLHLQVKNHLGTELAYLVCRPDLVELHQTVRDLATRPLTTWTSHLVAHPTPEPAELESHEVDSHEVEGHDRGPVDVAPQPVHEAQEVPSLAGELERLAVLHAGGALTDEEFALAKQRTLQSA